MVAFQKSILNELIFCLVFGEQRLTLELNSFFILRHSTESHLVVGPRFFPIIFFPFFCAKTPPPLSRPD